MAVMSEQGKCLYKNRFYRYVDKYLDLTPRRLQDMLKFIGRQHKLLP